MMSARTKEEVIDIKRRLETESTKKEPDTERIIDLLRLLDEVNINISILQSTQIGFTLKKFRKDSNNEIKSRTKAILQKWRDLVENSSSTNLSSDEVSSSTKSHQKQNKCDDNNDNNAVEEESKISSDILLKNDSKSPQDQISDFKQNNCSSAEALQHLRTSRTFQALDPMRQKTCEKLLNTLLLDFTTMEYDVDKLLAVSQGLAIEAAVNKAFSFTSKKQEYGRKLFDLNFNLKNNEELRLRVLADEVGPTELVGMTSEEMATREQQAAREKISKDMSDSRRLDWLSVNEDQINKQCGIASSEGLFQCGRCHSKKTSNIQKQTRSADEPMTIFITCLNCGKKWRQ